MKVKRAIVALFLCAALAGSAFGFPGPRTSQVSDDQLAPATTVFDTTYTTASSQVDTIWFGFYSNWVTGDVLDADVTVHYIQEDPHPAHRP